MQDDIDTRLIFLISQPRAGSTMLQRILGGHPKIHTAAEPWLMLPPIYALRQHTGQAPYDAELCRNAMLGFLDTLPDGEAVYHEAVRRMAGHLYQQSLEQTDKTYFLDKTPRYYLAISELIKVFPRAKFVLLLRNPIAVLTSILRTWVRSRTDRLQQYRTDLLKAPGLLLRGAAELGDRCVVVRYEDLLESPKSELQTLCGALGVEYTDDLVDYGERATVHWRYGDQARVNEHHHPVAATADRWLGDVASPRVWRLANDYLLQLGPAVINGLGYDYEQLRVALAERRPGSVSLFRTVSLSSLLNRPTSPSQAKESYSMSKVA